MFAFGGWAPFSRRFFHAHRASAKPALAATPQPAEGPFVEPVARPAGLPAEAGATPSGMRWRTAIGDVSLRRSTLIPLLLLVLILACLIEARTSGLQALIFSVVARGFGFHREPGASPNLDIPEGGPYDDRLGYSHLPVLLERLETAGFRIDSQARLSPGLQRIVRWGVPPIYREKTQAGLRVAGQNGPPLYEARYPERVFERFDAIPPLLVRSLLFIENREMLDPAQPYRNPAVDWRRLGKAVGTELRARVGQDRRAIGGSTLATQLEKLRHSPDGRTQSAGDKLGQMLSASLRAYRYGPETLAARRQVVLDYLNSLPLAAAPGYGEVHGLGDGLWSWYGMSFGEAQRLLGRSAAPADAARAQAYKRALSLILAVRRPNYYLVEAPQALEKLTDAYLRVLAQAGVIDAGLRDLALAQRLGLRPTAPPAPVLSRDRKGANLARARLAGLLGIPTLYDLDRLDLAVRTTLDGPAQEEVTRLLRSLRDPAVVTALGLRGMHLLDRGDPARVIYSFTLHERAGGINRVRVHTDSLDQPLDVNAGVKLDLGSTAKLRTLITYLEAVAALHGRWAGLTARELGALPLHPRDRLSAWAVEYLATARERGLTPMLEAALERRYSASPGEAFFTGGGLHTFANFDRADNARVLTVREGLRDSVNLVFIRLMRDLVNHYLYRTPDALARVLQDPADPRREAYLSRFADREGSEFIRRFYRKYQGAAPEDALDRLLAGVNTTPEGLAAIVRYVYPDVGLETFQEMLAARLPARVLSEEAGRELYDRHGPDRYPLTDRGYIARVHPLELWVMAYLRRHPGADLSQVVGASSAERQAVYGWLFRTRYRHAQDQRIAALLEMEAFLEIHRDWERLGYPFPSLTPSLATAIGSSGDRPAALAELLGIIAGGGVRYPTLLLETLDFASDTPYETRVGRPPVPAERILAPEVAATLLPLLTEVVERGTARGLRQALARDDGGRHVVGGKTGTGDHRYLIYGPGGQLIESRPVSRAATFAFVIDDRFSGAVTAYVPGPESAHYEFTSALPVRVLGLLLPTLSSLLDGPEPPRSGADTFARGEGVLPP